MVVLSAVAPDQGWAPGGQWTEAALTSLVGHATISARTRPLADNTFGAGPPVTSPMAPVTERCQIWNCLVSWS